MKVHAFTDLARSLLSQSQSRTLKSVQAQLSQELATGQVSDPVHHLKSNITVLADITQKSAMAHQYLAVNQETGFAMDQAQAVLTSIKGATEQFLDAVRIGSESGLSHAPDLVATEANAAIELVVNALNSAAAGRHLFAGQATDQQPLVSADALKSQVDASLASAASANDVNDQLDAFFAAGGDFESLAYLGSTTSLEPVKASDRATVQLELRADAQVFRDLLKSAFQARAASETWGLAADQRAELYSDAQNGALTAKDTLFEAASKIGVHQQVIEQSKAYLQAQVAAAEIVRTELLEADPFETASALEDVNARLEYIYAVTARSRNLSFLEFMR